MKRLVGIVLAVVASSAWSADEAASEPTPVMMEPEALEILRDATDKLAKLQTFRMDSRIEYDSIQDDGRSLEFGATRTTSVERPNKVRIETRHRDGWETELVADGQRIWYYTPEQNAYGGASQPGDIGVSLEFVALQLGIEQPLADLLAADPYAELAEGLTSAMIVGDSEIDGVACTHATYSNDVGDLQLWISQDDGAQIQRLAMTFRNEPGQPQFRADLVGFDPTPKFSPDTFVFTAPKTAERLRFIVPDATDATNEEE